MIEKPIKLGVSECASFPYRCDQISQNNIHHQWSLDAANSSQELVEFIDDNYSTVAEVATMLDQESDVIENWFHLGFKFGIKRESLDEIKYGQFTQNIMDYVYAKKPQLTVGDFYNVIEKLGRKDVLKKLDKFMAGELANAQFLVQ